MTNEEINDVNKNEKDEKEKEDENSWLKDQSLDEIFTLSEIHFITTTLNSIERIWGTIDSTKQKIHDINVQLREQDDFAQNLTREFHEIKKEYLLSLFAKYQDD